ncbi:MAG: [FeFe] hydrogenase H-cluster maturation GTPase HydF [Bacteroidales bacterium]|nr:[FeFe] hydrogenase H-cluster maturation GTPase HydF [Bacteroidales bacterium]
MKDRAVHIGVFGRINQGKSSLINALTGQDTAIVSDVPGTTTDPVKKSMEVFGIGPVVWVDTAGWDDDSALGGQRVRKTKAVLDEVDLALLVFSGNRWEECERRIAGELQAKDIPFVLVHNKSDVEPLREEVAASLRKTYAAPLCACSALRGEGREELIRAMVETIPPSAYRVTNMVADLVRPGDVVLLVMPQDGEAPEGRLILPQVQMIRHVLDMHAVPVAVQPEELAGMLSRLRPNLVITDSQVFAQVQAQVPPEIPLSSFSILLSRAKGNFEESLAGTPHIDRLRDGDRVLMLESCTHITSCEDIGRVKIPRLLRQYTGKQLHFDYVSSLDPLPTLSGYALAVQCGACMVTRRQIANRLKKIADAGVPISNYGMCIAYVTGIFRRVTAMFQK